MCPKSLNLASPANTMFVYWLEQTIFSECAQERLCKPINHLNTFFCKHRLAVLGNTIVISSIETSPHLNYTLPLPPSKDVAIGLSDPFLLWSPLSSSPPEVKHTSENNRRIGGRTSVRMASEAQPLQPKHLGALKAGVPHPLHLWT